MWIMFTLKNKYGNIVKNVETEREKEALLDKGYVLMYAKTEALSIEKMKVSEIEAIAESNGIDLSDCKNREEKISKIRESISYK